MSDRKLCWIAFLVCIVGAVIGSIFGALGWVSGWLIFFAFLLVWALISGD
jgi:hypothetical protein